jgi:hypothetical protein
VVLAGLSIQIVLVSTAWAQSSIGADAVVIGGNLQVRDQRRLDFQDVMPGGDYDVEITNSQSGYWTVSGTAGAEVQLTFLLPTLLWSGSHSMPISFGPTQAGHFIFNVPGFATLFDPTSGTVTTLRSFLSGVLHVWLGGSISAGPAQQAGVYTGAVTLVVSYTGT